MYMYVVNIVIRNSDAYKPIKRDRLLERKRATNISPTGNDQAITLEYLVIKGDLLSCSTKVSYSNSLLIAAYMNNRIKSEAMISTIVLKVIL